MKNENTNELPSFSTNEKPENPSAFPFVVEYHRHSETNEGMTLRDYFAAKAKDDFDNLDFEIKEIIVGRKYPNEIKKENGEPLIRYNYKEVPFGMEDILWIAEGRAKWKFIQADAMLKQRGQ